MHLLKIEKLLAKTKELRKSRIVIGTEEEEKAKRAKEKATPKVKAKAPAVFKNSLLFSMNVYLKKILMIVDLRI